MTTTGTKPTPAPTRKQQRAERKAEELRARYRAQAEALDSGQASSRDKRNATAIVGHVLAGGAYRTLRTKRARKIARALGWDTSRHEAGMMSTSQCAALDNALVATQPAIYGPGLGTDAYSGQTVTHSLIGLYPRVITSPNAVVVGDIGTGKSSFVKSLLDRILGDDPSARAATFDKKDQRQEEQRGSGGEYTRLARRHKGAVVPLNRDRRHGARINILDPRIAVTTREDDAGDVPGTIGQDVLLKVATVIALGRTLNGFESHALTGAHRAALTAAQAEGRIAVLPDVVHALFNPAASQVPDAGGRLTGDHVFDWGLELALALGRYVDGDMSGLIDGETSGPGGSELNLDARLTIFDTSALPDGSDALAVMMVVATTYLMARWASMPGTKTLVLEEAYSASNLAGVGEALRGLIKRSRGIGASVISVLHRLDDIREESPLAAIIKDAGVTHVFAQEKTDRAEAIVRLLGLPADMAEQIQGFERGRHLLHRGTKLPATIVDAFFTDTDRWTTYTDHAMEAQ